MWAGRGTAALTMRLNIGLLTRKITLRTRIETVRSKPSTLIGTWAIPRLTREPPLRPRCPLLTASLEIRGSREEPLPLCFGLTGSPLNS